MSLTTGLCALERAHDLVKVTVVKFWYDSLWQSKPVPMDELVLAQYSFKIPLQLRWAADHLDGELGILTEVRIFRPPRLSVTKNRNKMHFLPLLGLRWPGVR